MDPKLKKRSKTRHILNNHSIIPSDSIVSTPHNASDNNLNNSNNSNKDPDRIRHTLKPVLDYIVHHKNMGVSMVKLMKHLRELCENDESCRFTKADCNLYKIARHAASKNVYLMIRYEFFFLLTHNP